MAIFIAPDPNRAFFERVVTALQKQFPELTESQVRNGFVFSPFSVIMGARLAPNQSTYNFSPRNNVYTSYDTDNRLDQNDYFAVQAIGMKLSKATYTAASGALSQYGNYPKVSYPDPSLFVGNPASGLDEWQCLQTLLNGKYSLTVGSQQIIPSDNCQKLFYNPQSRYTASPLEYPQYNGLADPASRGNYNLPMNFILDMNQDNIFSTVLAPGDIAQIDGNVTSAGADATTRNMLWVEMEGIVIKNLGGNRAGSMSC